MVSIAARNEAKVLTSRIQNAVRETARSMERLKVAIDEAREARVHETLGFASWTAYITETCRSAAANLSEEDQRTLITNLAGVEGMSVRAIAPIVSMSKSTVSRKLQVSRRGTPGEAVEKVTGLDGKTYQPTPKAPKRTPITNVARDLSWQIRRKADAFRKAVDQLDAIRGDDRLARNRGELRSHLRGALLSARDDIDAMLAMLEEPR